MEDTEKAWMAGLFIGEGSVWVHRKLKKDGGEYRTVYVDISMTDKRAIQRFTAGLREIIGTNIVWSFRKKMQKGQTKQQYRVSVGGSRSLLVLAALRPWLEGSDKWDQAVKACRVARRELVQ